MAIEFRNETNRIYAIDGSGELAAEITFPFVDTGVVNINHTYVDQSLRGQGIADQLVRAVIDYLRANNLKAAATCPYVVKWFEKHQDEHDVLADVRRQAKYAPPFCTCADHECPLNPVNHDRGCDFCVAKCLREGEIPSCFFHKVSDDLEGRTDWTYAGFADLVAETSK